MVVVLVEVVPVVVVASVVAVDDGGDRIDLMGDLGTVARAERVAPGEEGPDRVGTGCERGGGERRLARADPNRRDGGAVDREKHEAVGDRDTAPIAVTVAVNVTGTPTSVGLAGDAVSVVDATTKLPSGR